VASLRQSAESFTRVLATREARRIAAGGLIGRFREGGTGLALILAVRAAGGSFAAAGAASAAYLAAAAACRPLHGRWVDRAGSRTPLLAGSAINSLTLGLIAFVAWQGAAAWTLVALSALAGVTLPALSATMRALWPQLAPDAGEHAYALDTLSYELSLIGAPALVGGLATLASPSLALLVISALGFAGTSVVALTPAGGGAPPRRGHSLRPHGLGAAVGTLIALSFCVGATEGSLTVLAPGVAAARHDRAFSGLLLSMLSIGSLAGALAYGRVSTSGTLRQRLFAGSAGLTFTCLLLAAFGATLAGFAATAVIVGLMLSPTLTAGFVAIRHAAAAGALTETFTWASLAAAGGAAVSQALAGALVAGDGARTALWIAPVAAGAGLLAATLGRASLCEP
jgi:MFS family permease